MSGIGPGQAYVGKLLARGKTRTEALRLLRRQLSDVAFTMLRRDERARASSATAVRAPLPAAA